MLFQDGIFVPQSLDDKRVSDVLAAAVARGFPVRPADFVHAVAASGDQRVLASITTALAPDAALSDLLEVIDIYHPVRTGHTFDGRRNRFSAEAIEALDEFDMAYARGADYYGDVTHGLELLLLSILRHLGATDRSMLRLIDIPSLLTALQRQASVTAAAPPPIFDETSGHLTPELFTAGAWRVLENSRVHAAELGYDQIHAPHCFLALLSEPSDVAERVIRRQLAPDISLTRIADAITRSFRLAGGTAAPPGLDLRSVGEGLRLRLAAAHQTARLWGRDQVGVPHLMAALLDDMPPQLATLLQGAPFRLNLPRMREHLDRTLRDAGNGAPLDESFRLPPALAPAEDLTWLARRGDVPPALHCDGYFEPVLRALHRRTLNHVLISGPRGVGTTTFVRELARRAAAGQVPFLAGKRFVLVDCGDLPPDRSGGKLRAIISLAASGPDVIACVDGLGPLLRGESGTTHKIALRAALREGRLQLIGIISPNDYTDLLASEPALLEFFTLVEMSEPSREQSLDIAGHIAGTLSREFDVTIEPGAVERAVALSADYILSDHHPRKAAAILRRACEDLDYERAQLGSEQPSVGPDDVIKVISEISGLPEGQLAGVGPTDTDYFRDLCQEVVGQDEAVEAVARELRRIKANLVQPGKPASVLLFAGLTGVGKTELAKAMARFHSASKSLRTYTMGNFTEEHSVAGITGSPPGYVSHDQGGRIVNDLNADPYCVFLLDEAEKAHPHVWKPFLNLFDEGWVVDQRGVKAFGDRAIFVLTSNVGSEIISRMAAAGNSPDEIAAAVRAELRKVRHQRSGEPVFAPEFLARIRQIIVFRPLSRDAMEGIGRKLIARRQSTWSRTRGKELVVPDHLITHIADASHERNVKSRDQEGGRIVEKMIAELVDDTIVAEVGRRPDEYRACDRVEILFTPPDARVSFVTEDSDPLRDEARLAVSELREILSADPGAAVDRAVRRMAVLEAAAGEHSAAAGTLRLARLALAQQAALAAGESRTLVAAAVSAVSAVSELLDSREVSPGVTE